MVALNFKAKIAERREVAKDTFEITLKFNNHFKFLAGQYVWVIIPKLLYEDNKGERRAFSILSSPTKTDLIKIFFRKSDSGYKKTLLELPLNSEVEVFGPFGSMTLPEKPGKPMIMIAGGTGISPFLSLIKFATENKIKQKMILFYANHDKESAAYLDELSGLTAKNPNFTYKNIFGRLSFDLVKQEIPDLKNNLWYVIGPNSLAEDIGNALYREGIEDLYMIFEQFHPSQGEPMRANRTLLDSVEFLRSALENTSIHIVITDINGYIVFCNKGAETTTKFTRSELIGQTPRVWGGLMSSDFYRKLWRTIKFEARPFISEIKNRKKTGEIYYAIAHITPLFDEKRNIVGFLATETDISKEKETEKNLIDAKARDEAILASIGDGLIITDENLKISSLNFMAEKLLGRQASELIGTFAPESIELRDKDDKPIPIVKRAFFNALKSRKIIKTSDYSFVRRDKTKFPAAITSAPIIFNKKLYGTVDIFRDITHEVEIDKEKTEFLSIASHQLRSPLGAMRWNMEILLAGDVGKLSDSVKESITQLYGSTLRLIGIINDLLVVSRIEQGMIKNEPVPTDILKIIKEALAEIEPEAIKRAIKIESFSEPQNIPAGLADPKRFREVIENLLSNAIKYSKQNSKIEIKVKQIGNLLDVSVTDMGIGIPTNDQHRIFSKFFRAPNAVSIDPNGSGMGLFVVKSYVESWGGNISFVSQENVGTTFTITVPLAQKI